ATALDMGIQLCWGLEHCHAKGIVHRDFKPLNVLMSADGTARLTDFGTVKFSVTAAGEAEAAGEVTDPRQTLGGPLQGTPPYMPPEEWFERSRVDHRADLYALGVTLHELLTGVHPVQPGRPSTEKASRAATVAAWAAAHTQGTPDRLRGLRPDVPEALEQM